MPQFVHYLYADFLKWKRQPQLFMHLIIPAVGISMFLAYYSHTAWTPMSKAAGYIEVLAVAFPALIGIVCSMSTEREAGAGNFQYLLIAPMRHLPFFSMLASLHIMGFAAVMLASVGFGIGFSFLLHLKPYSIDLYFYVACVLLISNLCLYVLHVLVGLRYGQGASIGLGIVESLLAALLLTGLGDAGWQFIPCAWGARFVSLLVQHTDGVSLPYPVISQTRMGISCCVAGTIAAMLFAGVWINRWEGKKSEE